MSATYDWGDLCPNCGGAFPFLHGPHPTWIPCTKEPDMSTTPTRLDASIAEAFNAKYQTRTDHGQDDDGNACVLCGRKTKPGSRAWVRCGGGGGQIVLPDFDDGPADMGCFPVGSECIKSVPAAYRIPAGDPRNPDHHRSTT